MKVFLLHKDVDFNLQRGPLPNEAALVQDLELDTLFAAMAQGDKFLYEVALRGVLTSLQSPDGIRYRQDVLRDCLAQPSLAIELYNLAVEAITGEKKIYRSITGSPGLVLSRSIEALELFLGILRRLRQFADDHASDFQSEGFLALLERLRLELDEEYFNTVEGHLDRLRFRGGVLISAWLGKGNKGTAYTLRRSLEPRRSWRERITSKGPPSFTFAISERDEAGARALAELRSRGISPVANAVARSSDHVLSFFRALRTELGFYVGCLNLHTQLAGKGEPMCYPEPVDAGEGAFSGRGLYDVCLSLRLETQVTGNDVDADAKRLLMITGANQGGKSTFLRSVGVMLLMVQAGMFVGARTLRASVCNGLFTHYKREEDSTMESGKLDEELKRMSQIVDLIKPGSLLLCNESFAATNEREGSEIASQVVRALLESGVRVAFVTHFYDLAGSFYSAGREDALFLRAERRPDGARTFRVIEGEPLATSYAEDVYERIFGGVEEASPAS